jgi:hypothetical protein
VGNQQGEIGDDLATLYLGLPLFSGLRVYGSAKGVTELFRSQVNTFQSLKLVSVPQALL